MLRLASLALLVLSLLGCGVAAPSTPAPTTETSRPTPALPTVTAAAEPTTSPSPRPQLTTGPTAGALAEGPLAPGEYQVTHFEPNFSFVVAESGWAVEYLGPAALGLLRSPSSDVGEFAVNVFRVDTFVTAVDPQTGERIEAPTNIAGWLQAHRFLELVGPPEQTTVAGQLAVQFDMLATQEADEMVPGGNEPGMVPLLGEEEGCCLNLEPGAGYRWTFFEVDGVPMWINLIAFDADQLDAAAEEARPVIESIEFE